MFFISFFLLIVLVMFEVLPPADGRERGFDLTTSQRS